MNKYGFLGRALNAFCSLMVATGLVMPPVVTAFASETGRGGDLAPAVVEEGVAQVVSSTDRIAAVAKVEQGSANSWRYGIAALEDTSKLAACYGPWWNESNGISSYSYNDDGEDVRVDVSGVKSLGIDVSEHQGTISWSQVKTSGVTFAIIRCGFGDTTCRDDLRWLDNVKGAKDAGIAIGVYIYSYATTVAEAKSEADHVLSALEKAGLSPSDLDLPVFYDLEESSLESTSNRTLLANMATAFCSKIQAEGYEVGIYSNVNWWTNYLTDSAFNNKTWHRWVAGYYWGLDSIFKKVSVADMWQFCSQGSVVGISGNVDMNFRFVDTPSDNEAPVISDVEIVEERTDGYMIQCKVSDNVGVTRVLFPSWRSDKSGANAKWYEGTISDGVAKCFVRIDDLGGGASDYITHIYAYDASGNVTGVNAGSVSIDPDWLVKASAVDLGDDFYARVVNEGRGTAVTASSLVSGGAITCSNVSKEATDNQLWHFVRNSDGTYALLISGDSLALDVYGATSAENASLVTYARNSSTAQKWKLIDAGDGSYYLVPACSTRRALDLCNYSADDGAPLVVHTSNKTMAQRFRIDDGDHVWGVNRTVDKCPTCTESGSSSLHCMLCSEVKDERSLPALGHTFQDRSCSVCSALLGDVNGNGTVNVVDAQIAYDIATSSIYEGQEAYPAYFSSADVTGDDGNPDGIVDATDARCIQYVAIVGWDGC